MKLPTYIANEFFVKKNYLVHTTTTQNEQIFNAECKKIKLKTIVMSLNCLKVNYKNFLLELLQKYKKMFDGTLRKYSFSNYIIDLQDNAKPNHAKPFSIPIIHEPSLKKEVDRLIKI